MTTLALLNNVPPEPNGRLVLTTGIELDIANRSLSRVDSLDANSRIFGGSGLTAAERSMFLKQAQENIANEYKEQRKRRDSNFKLQLNTAGTVRVNPDFLATNGDWAYNETEKFHYGASLRIYKNQFAPKAVGDPVLDFILTAAAESDGERLAPIYTFGTPVCFTAGRRPRMFSYSGEFLVNQKDKNSKDAFWTFYEKRARASSALINREDNQYIPKLRYQNREISGVMTALQTPITAQDTHKIPFNFSIFVYEERVV